MFAGTLRGAPEMPCNTFAGTLRDAPENLATRLAGKNRDGRGLDFDTGAVGV